MYDNKHCFLKTWSYRIIDSNKRCCPWPPWSLVFGSCVPSWRTQVMTPNWSLQTAFSCSSALDAELFVAVSRFT